MVVMDLSVKQYFALFKSILSVSIRIERRITLCFKKGLKVDGWIDDLRFYVLFNSISVISGRWEVDKERLCAMELRLWLRFRLEQGLNSVG